MGCRIRPNLRPNLRKKTTRKRRRRSTLRPKGPSSERPPTSAPTAPSGLGTSRTTRTTPLRRGRHRGAAAVRSVQPDLGFPPALEVGSTSRTMTDAPKEVTAPTGVAVVSFKPSFSPWPCRQPQSPPKRGCLETSFGRTASRDELQPAVGEGKALLAVPPKTGRTGWWRSSPPPPGQPPVPPRCREARCQAPPLHLPPQDQPRRPSQARRQGRARSPVRRCRRTAAE